MTEVTFKVDIDYKMNKAQLNLFEDTKINMLEFLGFKINEVNTNKSDKKGRHWWFLCEHKRKHTPTELNFIQLLLGDDYGRVFLNQVRIGRKMKWDNYTNFIFSKIYCRRPADFSKKKFNDLIKKSKLSKEERETITEYVKNLERICNKFKSILQEGAEEILKAK